MGILTELSLFTGGLAGFSLGLKLTGLPIRTVCYVEWDKYRQEIIKARIRDGCLNDAPIWDDINTFDGSEWRGSVDIITGGFPCQPHSTAGRRKGAEDSRNLWPQTCRVISDVGARFVYLENVPGITQFSKKQGRAPYALTVLRDLASLGYDAVWGTMGARDVGAPHRRDRWLIMAYSPKQGLERGELQKEAWVWSQQSRIGLKQLGNSNGEGSYKLPPWPPSPTSNDWAGILVEHPELSPATEIEPSVRGMAHGRSNRVDRLKALGDGVIPAVVSKFWQIAYSLIADIEEEE